MWTLILTLAIMTNGYKSGGTAASLETVPGFASQEACLVAGNEWLRQANTAKPSIGSNRVSYNARALCVHTPVVK